MAETTDENESEFQKAFRATVDGVPSRDRGIGMTDSERRVLAFDLEQRSHVAQVRASLESSESQSADSSEPVAEEPRKPRKRRRKKKRKKLASVATESPVKSSGELTAQQKAMADKLKRMKKS